MDFLSQDNELLRYEQEKWREGFFFVAGVDEVGRGPLAGPVVAAAVVFPSHSHIPPVNDSKLLQQSRRRELRDAILAVPDIDYAIAEIKRDVIDHINILQASRLAMRNALKQLRQLDFILVDGLPVPDLPAPNLALVKGDRKSASIAAASIIAKEYRDDLMIAYAEQYPQYGFENHKGYGTKAHLEAIRKYGICPLHRRSFAPVKAVISPAPEQPEFW